MCILLVFLEQDTVVFQEGGLDLFSFEADEMFGAIVFVAVLKDEEDICFESFAVRVEVVFEFLFYCGKVHRLLNDLEIVLNTKFFGRNRFMKPLCSFFFPANR